MTKTIGVIGCGWLGLPLAEKLVKSGFIVRGTTTSNEKIPRLKALGIEPYQISITETKAIGPLAAFLQELDVLIINIPPGLRTKGAKESYIAKITLLHKHVTKSSLTKIVFVGSTSVYGDVEGMVTEQTRPRPNTASGKQLLACENVFKNDGALDTTVIRFGGLIGPDRHPITILSKKETLSGGNAAVNLIHLDDCIGIIMGIIEKQYWNTTLNGVYPEHPTKEIYYTKIAMKRNLPAPNYVTENNKRTKIISSCSIFLTNNYEFLTSIY